MERPGYIFRHRASRYGLNCAAHCSPQLPMSRCEVCRHFVHDQTTSSTGGRANTRGFSIATAGRSDHISYNRIIGLTDRRSVAVLIADIELYPSPTLTPSVIFLPEPTAHLTHHPRRGQRWKLRAHSISGQKVRRDPPHRIKHEPKHAQVHHAGKDRGSGGVDVPICTLVGLLGDCSMDAARPRVHDAHYETYVVVQV